MPTQLQTAPDAVWKQRYRAPRTYGWPAVRNAARGMAVSNRSGVYQLYAWEPATGELRQLTERPTGKGGGVIDPQGRHIYYHDDKAGDEIGRWVRVRWEADAASPAEDITPELPPYASWHLAFSREGNRIGISVAGDDGFAFLVAPVDQAGAIGAFREIYRCADLAFGPYFSADGTLAAIMSTERTQRPQYGVIVVDVASGERVTELWEAGASSLYVTTWAPRTDDTRLLLGNNAGGELRPMIWDVRSGERRELPVGDLGGDVQAFDWSEDGRQILLLQLHNAENQLWIYDLESGELKRVQHAAGTIGGPKFVGDAIWLDRQDSTQPPAVEELDATTGELRRVLLSTPDAPAGRRWRSVRFASGDGTPIQGWLATPDGDGPWPAILETHGGPEVCQTEVYAAGSQAWLDHGYAFLTINYRGSTGFGRAFEQAIWGNIGRLEVEDMAAARAWLIEQGIAKPDEILLTGWSYGGYLTLLGLGKQPELWAGGMAGIAIADWAVQYEDSAETLKAYQVALFGGTPQEKPELYTAAAPISYAENVAAPVLVIQGSNDTRCPARPMRSYEAKLRALGKDITVHWFEAGHGSYAVEQNIEHQERMLRFAQGVLG